MQTCSVNRLSKGTMLLTVCLIASSSSGASIEIGTWAAPELMIFHGGQLESRIVFPDLEENHRFLGSTSTTTRAAGLDDRHPLCVALFWGMQWRPYARNPSSWSGLDLARASQHALFYPGTRDTEAVLLIKGTLARGSLRIVGPDGLQILSGRGVPIEMAR
jgi:hypothetical protein